MCCVYSSQYNITENTMQIHANSATNTVPHCKFSGWSSGKKYPGSKLKSIQQVLSLCTNIIVYLQNTVQVIPNPASKLKAPLYSQMDGQTNM
jgi:hypothetical protein